MRRYDLLLQTAFTREIALAGSLSLPEAQEQVVQLRARLDCNEDQLDFGPKSLNLLVSKLMTYYINNKILFDEDLVSLQLMREIASYFGLVLMQNTRAKWVQGHFPLAHIETEGIFVTQKGGTKTIFRSRSVPLGPIAAGSLDALDLNVKPKLYKLFQMATTPTVSERLDP